MAPRKTNTKTNGKAKPNGKKPPKIPSETAIFEPPPLAGNSDELIIEGLRQNNLKNISVSIPHDKITTVVGLSGSGKSSFAFDTLFAEGRWRFIESLSTYTRLFLERMDRPDLDLISNIRPSIAIEQKNPVRTSRSTVGTATEINDYLRIIFARVGKTHCPQCRGDVKSWNAASTTEDLLSDYKDSKSLIGFEMHKNSSATTEEIIQNLTTKGFIRAEQNGQVIDLSSEVVELNTTEPIHVVIDRLVIKEDNRSRLSEALEASFLEGMGDVWINILGEEQNKTLKYSKLFQCSKCDIELDKPTPLLFSFNHPVGACPECKGFGNTLNYDEDKIIPDRSKSLGGGAIEPWTKPAYTWWYEELKGYAKKYKINMEVPYSDLTKEEKDYIFNGTEDFEGINDFFDQLETKKYKLHIRVFISRYKGQFLCLSCNGSRVKQTALNITVGGLNIAEVSEKTIQEARDFFKSLELSSADKIICKDTLGQIILKLDFLCNTGLEYITLDRLTRTLSGGEAQRVALANQLASSLCGVLYILDEPSIGLHPKDVAMLTEQIKQLAQRGNTVVCVEHDSTIMEASDHVVELGPGAGEKGGRVVFSGSKSDFMKGDSLTAKYLKGDEEVPIPRWRRKGDGNFIELKGATGNNLAGADITVPLKTFSCVTGVSGSGKSTLIIDTLYKAIEKQIGNKNEKPLPYKSITGLEHIEGVKLISQEPIGRTPRSNPATYIGCFDEIRQFYASLPASTAAGFKPGSFSFNVPGGRCEVCRGEGVEKLEMYFLPDVYTSCGSCSGKRYKPQVLDVKYRGKNIYDILNMTFETALGFFSHPALTKPGSITAPLQKKFTLMIEVGLGYLTLGQAANTLSGGEAQRVKIAKELLLSDSKDYLYILDEPTTGLHMEDIKKLLSVLGKLVDTGSTVVVVEHNLDCIKTADFITDLGPGGGSKGGKVLCSGVPEDILDGTESHTARFLKPILA